MRAWEEGGGARHYVQHVKEKWSIDDVDAPHRLGVIVGTKRENHLHRSPCGNHFLDSPHIEASHIDN